MRSKFSFVLLISSVEWILVLVMLLKLNGISI